MIEGLSLDDVLLVPRRSKIESRFSGEISLESSIFPVLSLKYPILSANMDTITENRLANKMFELGGLGIIHRFTSVEKHIEELKQIMGPRIVCIGSSQEGLERLKVVSAALSTLTHKDLPDGVLIDVAHGHSDQVINQIEAINKWTDHTLPIIAGNVATYEGTVDLISAGAACIKCGIGPGMLCSTRISTGNGVPQFTAITECARAIKEVNKPVSLIADGGIKNAGDIIKALAAGANLVMIGGLFAGTEETPGEIKPNREPYFNPQTRALEKITMGKDYKEYRGQASKEFQLEWKGKTESIEGICIKVEYKGLLEQVFKSLIANILSGMSYQGATNLSELQRNATFIRQTQSGYREGIPRGD